MVLDIHVLIINVCVGVKKACVKQAIIIKRSYNNDFMNVGVESLASKILLRRI